MMWNGLIVAIAVIIATVPWGLPGETTFILPFVTLLPIFAFSALREKRIPGWLPFVAGLATDILTAGPLGYWAFLYTLCHALARLMAHRAPAQTIGILWLQFLLVATLVSGAGWSVAVLYYLRPIDWWPMGLGAMVSMLLCPLVLLPLRRSIGRANRLALG